MSEIQATYQATDTAFHVEGYEKIAFDLLYVQGAFAAEHPHVAERFRDHGRCLMVVDEAVDELSPGAVVNFLPFTEVLA